MLGLRIKKKEQPQDNTIDNMVNYTRGLTVGLALKSSIIRHKLNERTDDVIDLTMYCTNPSDMIGIGGTTIKKICATVSKEFGIKVRINIENYDQTSRTFE